MIWSCFVKVITQIPAKGAVYSEFLGQLSFRDDVKKISDDHHLIQHNRIHGRLLCMRIILTAQPANEVHVQYLIYSAN
jgi:hypothetical protein